MGRPQERQQKTAPGTLWVWGARRFCVCGRFGRAGAAWPARVGPAQARHGAGSAANTGAILRILCVDCAWICGEYGCYSPQNMRRIKAFIQPGRSDAHDAQQI